MRIFGLYNLLVGCILVVLYSEISNAFTMFCKYRRIRDNFCIRNTGFPVSSRLVFGNIYKRVNSGILYELPEGWMHRADQEYIMAESEEDLANLNEESLFDAVYSDSSQSQPYSISQQSILDLAKTYHFSSAYLGDIICGMGSPAPLDINAPLGNYLNGNQIHSLLEDITTWDPYEVNDAYYPRDMTELANNLGTTTEKVLQICNDEKITLPFGISTRLHRDFVEKIKSSLEFDESLNPTIDISCSKENKENM